MPQEPLISVGCASMDVQHRLLVKLVEQAVASLRRGDPDHVFLGEVLEFRAALAAHFEVEQDQLLAAGFPRWQEHADKHRLVLQRLDDAVLALRNVTSSTARFAIIMEIEDVIYFHELLDDSSYAGQLNDDETDISWNDSLKVGVEWVDEQHQQLFTILAALRHHARRGEWDLCQFDINRLVERVRAHFENEDAFLRPLGASTLDHRRHHFEALMTLEGLLDEVGPEALKGIHLFIYQLLRSHIQEEDRRDFHLCQRP